MANDKAAKPEAAEGEEAPKGGGKMKLIVLAAVGLLVLGGGGGAAAYFLGFFGSKQAAAVPAPDGDAAHGDGHGEAKADGHGEKDQHAAAAPAADAHGAPGHAPTGPTVAFVELPDILVNLRSSNKRMRFLKLKVALEVKDDKMVEQIKLLTPRILDGFQIYLRALEAEEIEGSRGMQTLKEELIARINHAVSPSRVTDVLFKEILVQ